MQTGGDANKRGMGKDIQGYVEKSRRYGEDDKSDFPGAYKPGIKILGLMRDNKSWRIAEVYKVRISKFFNESDSDDEEINEEEKSQLLKLPLD